MLFLILILIVSSLLVYISQYNLSLVTVDLGVFAVTDVPLFYVIIGSVLFGLIVAYIFSLISSISTSIILRRKDNELKQEKAEALELTKRIHQLELEQEKRKNGELIEVTDKNAL